MAVLATLDIRSENRHGAHDRKNILAKACEMQVQSMRSILLILLGNALFS
jgi:hypothetical protein